MPKQDRGIMSLEPSYSLGSSSLANSVHSITYSDLRLNGFKVFIQLYMYEGQVDV